jgi:uncharacterized protein (DUF2384 family)
MTLPAQPISYQYADFAPEPPRKKLTKIIIRLLDEWDLKTAEQLRLLGLRETSRNMLKNYRDQVNILPFDQDKLERAGLLLNIYKNIYDLYPENANLRKTWIKRTNTMLGNKTPLEIMLENGLFGMADVMRFLDLQKVM